jgi:DNA-binding NtrC family response regulator
LRTILVVDDDQEVLTFVQSALMRLGFDVILAQNGELAMTLFEKRAASIDMLLTDVVMPGISGPMLVDRILAMQPSLPVLFMSGYDDRQVVQRYVLHEGFALLPKPFTLETLHAKVHELLPVAPVISKQQNA